MAPFGLLNRDPTAKPGATAPFKPSRTDPLNREPTVKTATAPSKPSRTDPVHLTPHRTVLPVPTGAGPGAEPTASILELVNNPGAGGIRTARGASGRRRGRAAGGRLQLQALG